MYNLPLPQCDKLTLSAKLMNLSSSNGYKYNFRWNLQVGLLGWSTLQLLIVFRMRLEPKVLYPCTFPFMCRLDLTSVQYRSKIRLHDLCSLILMYAVRRSHCFRLWCREGQKLKIILITLCLYCW